MRVGERQSGFTMVEVVMATAVVAIALLGTFSALDGARRSATRSREMGLALAAARAKIEEVRASPVADIVTLFNGSGFGVEGLSAQMGDADDLAGEVSITRPSGATGPYEVLVSVRWQSVTGRNDVSLRTWIGLP